MKHIPILRFGPEYTSLNQSDVVDHRNGDVLATVSLANAGLIRRDLRNIGNHFDVLQNIPQADLMAMCKKAAEFFMTGDMPMSVDDYVRVLSLTSGLPHTLCRANMGKIAHVMANMDVVLGGLTRGINLDMLDTGLLDGLSYYANTDALGVILPSNSPGVNSLYLPTIALKVPLMLKPGREEPWTPFRVIQSFIAAGVPKEAFGFYPATHEGSGAVLNGTKRCILFGDKKVAKMYSGNSGISVHGPGYSKVLLGPDAAANWEQHLDSILDSLVTGGGRSCINASTILVPSHAAEIGAAIAERLDAIEPLPLDHPEARLSAFAKSKVAHAINGAVDAQLEGANLLTRPDRAVTIDGSVFLRPTLVHCPDLEHPLARTEYLFPYASIVEVPAEDLVSSLGPSLVVSAITEDPALRRQLLASPDIQRLNLGGLPTTRVEWNQPHEGNLFEFLYSRRAIQLAG